MVGAGAEASHGAAFPTGRVFSPATWPDARPAGRGLTRGARERPPGRNGDPSCRQGAGAAATPLGGRVLSGASAYRHPGRHRTAEARAAQSAIAVRHLCEVLLVVVLGEIERRSIANLGGDRTIA